MEAIRSVYLELDYQDEYFPKAYLNNEEVNMSFYENVVSNLINKGVFSEYEFKGEKFIVVEIHQSEIRVEVKLYHKEDFEEYSKLNKN